MMTSEQLIKSAHVWALAALLLCAVIAIAGKNETKNQNSKQQNANAPGTQNSNSSKAKSRNSNTGDAAKDEQTGTANLASQDKDFIMEAAMGGMMEVELGRIAAQQGTSDAVKQFGQKMVDDHSRANSKLMQLASSKSITLPTELDEKHREDVTKMSKVSGAEFDKAYAKAMLSDHNKDVAAFEKESTKGTDPDVKSFASETLPTLREHLQMAKALNSDQTPGMKNSNVNRP
jgi:putative membrane protein